MTDIGHNSGDAVPFPSREERGRAASPEPAATDERLKRLVERVIRLEEEKKGIGDDIRDVYAEARSLGYDSKTTRAIVRLTMMDPDKRREEEAVLETYKCAVGLD